MEGTMKCSANYVPLSPISYLERAAVVFGTRTSVIYGDIQYTWNQTRDRCVRLASALSDLGLSRHDVVAALAPNIPALIELYFGAPMSGSVLCVLNPHYDSRMLAMALEKTKPKVFFVDSEFLSVAEESLTLLSNIQEQPIIITITEHPTEKSKHVHYEDFLSSGNPNFKPIRPVDECDPIALNFTSGTTSTPKCVVYSHRGAYLNAMAVGVTNEMKPMPVYLWTVPMYHCSGWSSVWTVAAYGGVNVCLREVNDRVIFDSIVKHKVTDFGGSPAVLNMIANAQDSVKKSFPWTVQVMSGGSSPPEVILRLKKLGFKVMMAFGCTELYGLGTACFWMPEWETIPEEESIRLKARDGLNHFAKEAVDVMDPTTMEPVPHDGKTIGEIVLRGNTVMSGYYKNKEATEAAFRGGWFWSRDMAVIDPDGYIHWKERSQDVITCEGESMGSKEIEGLLYSHPAVYEAAIVGQPDETLGESMCAFVKLKEGVEAKEEEIIEFCKRKIGKTNMKLVPKTVVFTDVPRTPTGKIRKNVMRNMTKNMK
ncbi:PREDICTED: probable acyl-activating enzyme 21 [Camelina sativa]|uniref:Probable acyl-activating enzyme 21 n=1 Tax=Camelina sativa TaxID=90675 RepID=A0ABM1QAC6_CAMSA|nr:PREDICTED: probable acyl-activating enzyme 21 [Camelina sativa]